MIVALRVNYVVITVLVMVIVLLLLFAWSWLEAASRADDEMEQWLEQQEDET